MRFIARTPTKYFEGTEVRSIQPGRRVPDELVDEGLLKCGAIEEINLDDDDDTAEAALSDKPLAKQTKPELLVTADAELVEVPEGATNAQIVALIEAKRAAQQKD